VSLYEKRIPDLVRSGWFFWPMWDDYLGGWHVDANKSIWGISAKFFAKTWEEAHEKAAEFAEEEERIINAPECCDTERPAAEVGHAE
jgi:hypothetical protein